MLLSSGKNKLKYLPIEPETSERITKSACDKNSDVPSCRYCYVLLTGIFTAKGLAVKVRHTICSP